MRTAWDEAKIRILASDSDAAFGVGEDDDALPTHPSSMCTAWWGRCRDMILREGCTKYLRDTIVSYQMSHCDHRQQIDAVRGWVDCACAPHPPVMSVAIAYYYATERGMTKALISLLFIPAWSIHIWGL